MAKLVMLKNSASTSRTIQLYSSSSDAKISGGKVLKILSPKGEIYYAPTIPKNLVVTQSRIRATVGKTNDTAIVDTNKKTNKTASVNTNFFAPFGAKLVLTGGNGAYGGSGAAAYYTSRQVKYLSWKYTYYTTYIGSGCGGGSCGTSAIASVVCNGKTIGTYVAPSGCGGGGGGGGRYQYERYDSPSSIGAQGAGGSGGGFGYGTTGTWNLSTSGTYKIDYLTERTNYNLSAASGSTGGHGGNGLYSYYAGGNGGQGGYSGGSVGVGGQRTDLSKVNYATTAINSSSAGITITYDII